MLPVLVEELELERVRDLRRRDPGLRNRLEPADHEASDLLLDVDVAVGVTQDRQVRVHALELVGDDVEVLGRVQRHRHADLVAEGLGPLAGTVDDDLGLDVAGVRPYAGHAPSARGLGRVDAEDTHPLVDADAVAARALGQREGEVRRVGPPVLGQPDGTEQVVDGDDRPALLGLLGREHLAVEVEGRRGGGRPPQLHHPVLGARHDQPAALAVAGGQSGLGLEPGVQLGGVLHQPRAALAGAQQPDQAGRVPGGAARQRALLEEHDVGPAELGEVVRRRAADHAAADDDDAGAGREVSHRRRPCRGGRRSRRR